jgi:hypothetical protein
LVVRTLPLSVIPKAFTVNGRGGIGATVSAVICISVCSSGTIPFL